MTKTGLEPGYIPEYDKKTGLVPIPEYDKKTGFAPEYIPEYDQNKQVWYPGTYLSTRYVPY